MAAGGRPTRATEPLDLGKPAPVRTSYPEQPKEKDSEKDDKKSE